MPQGKYVPTKSAVANAISDAASVVEELKDEMSEWRDAMEDKLSHTDKYERVSEAADALDQADVTSKAEALNEALEEAAHGKPAKPGCPKHVVGTPCKLCKWDGIAKKPHGEKKTIKRFKPPKREKTSGKPRWIFAEVSAGYWSESYQHTATDSKTRAADLAEFENVVAAVIKTENKRLDTLVIPMGRAPEPEVLPIAALAGLVDAEVSYSEFQAYKGKSPSRANRLSNATSAGKAAVEHVREVLETCESKDERIDEISNAIEEFEAALDECESVDFPGMYG